MASYGCIGKKLTHSFSKEIHAKLADYEYKLIELKEDELKDFFSAKDFKAINVTIPYKQDVIPFLDYVSNSTTYNSNNNGNKYYIFHKNPYYYLFALCTFLSPRTQSTASIVANITTAASPPKNPAPSFPVVINVPI